MFRKLLKTSLSHKFGQISTLKIITIYEVKQLISNLIIINFNNELGLGRADKF